MLLIIVIYVLILPPWRYNKVNQQIVEKVQSWFRSFRDFCYFSVWIPTYRALCSIGRTLRYYVCGHWIPPLCARINNAYNGLKYYLKTRWIDPTFAFIAAVLTTVRYYVCGHWIPPLLFKISEARKRGWSYVRSEFVDPTLAFFLRIFNGICYVVLLRWIPPLLEWINGRIVRPALLLANRVKDFGLYVVYGGWIPRLGRF